MANAAQRCVHICHSCLVCKILHFDNLCDDKLNTNMKVTGMYLICVNDLQKYFTFPNICTDV